MSTRRRPLYGGRLLPPGGVIGKGAEGRRVGEAIGQWIGDKFFGESGTKLSRAFAGLIGDKLEDPLVRVMPWLRRSKTSHKGHGRARQHPTVSGHGMLSDYLVKKPTEFVKGLGRRGYGTHPTVRGKGPLGRKAGEFLGGLTGNEKVKQFGGMVGDYLGDKLFDWGKKKIDERLQGSPAAAAAVRQAPAWAQRAQQGATQARDYYDRAKSAVSRRPRR